jgi:hypothetical protein
MKEVDKFDDLPACGYPDLQRVAGSVKPTATQMKYDDRWGRMCAEHALPLGWETMEYEEFLRERGNGWRKSFVSRSVSSGASQTLRRSRRRGSCRAPRPLRAVVREVYAARFREAAAQRIEEALPERERESLARALWARPAGSEPLSIVDYLYLAQLPPPAFRDGRLAGCSSPFGRCAGDGRTVRPHFPYNARASLV